MVNLQDAEDAGVVKFKKGYNAEIIEYVGDLLNQLINLFTQHIPHLKKLKTEFFRKGIIKT
ncbi:hypothetical protein ACVNP1_10865 [Staphylococcus aureus]